MLLGTIEEGARGGTQGNLQAAHHWADMIDLQLDDDLSFLREAEYLTWVRVRIAQWRSESTSPDLHDILRLDV